MRESEFGFTVESQRNGGGLKGIAKEGGTEKPRRISGLHHVMASPKGRVLYYKQIRKPAATVCHDDQRGILLLE